ncbi:MAG: (d)CMP kinase [Clostridia bacterium]
MKEDMIKRDIQDKTRKESPLIKVKDSILIDTSNLTKIEAVKKCLNEIIIKQKS